MATNTYTALRTTTLSSTASAVDFDLTGITGYTDLVIVVNTKVTSGSYQNYMRLGNGSIDSGNNYSFTILNGDGGSASSLRAINYSYIGGYFDYNTSADGMMSVTHLQNYSNTTTYKTVLQRGSNANTGVAATVGLWRSTAAINKIQIYPSGSTYAAGSTFTVYGIAAVGTSPAPKATGGTLYSDDTYYYHVFGSSGTFTPSQSITADYLIVAGGGAGGGGTTAGNCGGGGAGGLLYGSSSLTATGYSVVVGAGGSVNTTSNGSNGVNTTFNSLTAIGGGGGAYFGTSAGNSGGSGGGAGQDAAGTGGAGTSGQGFAGGNSTGYRSGAGGGGASAAGGNDTGSPTYNAGPGGNGSSSYSSWLSVTGIGVSGSIAGGGGGSSHNGNSTDQTQSRGGTGGGGYGAYTTGGTNYAAVAGVANTGSGGGAGGENRAAAAGGSGIVIVRYAKA